MGRALANPSAAFDGFRKRQHGAVTHRRSFNGDVSRWVSQELYPSFCNGPRFVNPFLRHAIAGVALLYGVGAKGRHLMGFEEDRPTNLQSRGVCHGMGNGLT